MSYLINKTTGELLITLLDGTADGPDINSGANSADGKPTNEDIAKIWANSPYSNSADNRNSEARYAMTGKPNLRKQ